ncbi:MULTISPECIES: hypothetical protein [unclassified Nocardioides]|uniref:hypothetical protein n=1 Tax=unclassified Nocardioides TaxID=2615069 RepID=UPI003608B20C
MNEADRLTSQAYDWAVQKSRPLDPALLATVLYLRSEHDGLGPDEWPADSVEQLVLVTWPRHGPPPPDPGHLGDTLDTYWSFLRATRQTSRGSARRSRLRKEARRLLPRLAEACALAARVPAAPAPVVAEPVAPAPPEPAGPVDLTGLIELAESGDYNDVGRSAPPAAPAPPAPAEAAPPADRADAAHVAREPGFVSACLTLADWVGEGREVTARGHLRPAVAREAYRDLNLWSWERELEALISGLAAPPAHDAARAEAALHSWRSARDCLPLDRLWSACVSTGLVDVDPKVARRSPATPRLDEEWVGLANALLLALCRRLGREVIEPLSGLLLIPTGTPDAPVSMAAVRSWWMLQRPESWSERPERQWQRRLDVVMAHLHDANLWRVEGDRIVLTDLGAEFAPTFVRAVREGFFEEESA